MMSGHGSAHVDELHRHITVLESVIEREDLAGGEIAEINDRLTAIDTKQDRLTNAYAEGLAPAFKTVAEHYTASCKALETIAAAVAPKPPPASSSGGLVPPSSPQPPAKPTARKRQIPQGRKQ